MKTEWYPYPELRPLAESNSYWVYTPAQRSSIGLYWQPMVDVMKYDARIWLALGVTHFADIVPPEPPTEETTIHA